MAFEHLDMVPETPADYRKIAEAHEAAAARFTKPGFERIAEEYLNRANSNRAIALRLGRFDTRKAA